MRLLLSMLTGGVVCDAVSWLLRRVPDARVAYRLLGALAPLSVWSSYVAFSVAESPIVWSAEQWSGTVVWSALIGLALTVLLLPPRNSPAGYLD